MMVHSARGGLRSGLSGSGVLALVAGAVILLVTGYFLGSLRDDAPSTDSQTTAPAPAPAQAPAQAEPPTSANALPASRATARSAFRFEPAELDFGAIAIGQTAEGSFEIVNTGSEPLRVLAMRASCQCTTLRDLSGTTIAPGARERVEARIDSRSYPTTARSQIRFVFEGHDPVQYELRAAVTHPVQAMPRFLQAQESRTGEVDVHSTDGAVFRILAAHGEAPVYTCGFDPRVDEPRTRYVLAWDFSLFSETTCKDPDGRAMPRWWVVETDHPHAPLVEVRVRHAPCTMLELPSEGRRWILADQRHTIGQVEPGSSHEFTMALRWLQNQSPSDTIRSVSSQDSVVTAELLEVTRIGDEITCRVRVTVHPDHSGLIYSEVRFHAFQEGHSAGLTIIGRAAPGSVVQHAAPEGSMMENVRR